jgi:hypothetical protein
MTRLDSRSWLSVGGRDQDSVRLFGFIFDHITVALFRAQRRRVSRSLFFYYIYTMASRSICRIKPRISRPEIFISSSSRGSLLPNRYYAAQSDPNETNDTSAAQPRQNTLETGRDPRLPPKPPAGTYPHAFQDSRDDPHSNSMRLHYQHPTTIRTTAGATSTCTFYR